MLEEQQFAACLEKLYEVLLAQCLHMLGNRDDAQDATQETLKNAWANRAKYTPRPGKDFENWVRRIATNACYDLLRKRKAALPVISEADITNKPGLHPQIDIWPALVTNEIMASLKACLDERDFWMFKQRLARLTLNEIAAELPDLWKLNYEGVKSRFDRQIKRCLEEAKKKFE